MWGTWSWWEPAGGSSAGPSPPPGLVPPPSAQQPPPDAEVAVGLATPCGDSGGGEDRGPTAGGDAVLASPRESRALSGGAEALGGGGLWPKHPETQGMRRTSGSDALPLQNPLLGGNHSLPSRSVTERDPKAGVPWGPWGGLGMPLEVMAALGPDCPQAGGCDSHPTTAAPCPSPERPQERTEESHRRHLAILPFWRRAAHTSQQDPGVPVPSGQVPPSSPCPRRGTPAP